MKRYAFTGILLCIFAVAGLVLMAQPAAAQTPPPPNCIQDVWMAHGNHQNLTCTANDVRLSQVTNIDIVTGGSCSIVNGVRRCVCAPGANVTFAADFQMDLTAEARYDIGFFIAKETNLDAVCSYKGALPGSCSALTGQCTANGAFQSNGHGLSYNFINLDPSPPDLCGDITGPYGSDYNPQLVRALVTVQCTPGDDGRVLMPWCTTWRQPGANDVCIGVGNGTTTNDLYPGSPSKCACSISSIDIFTENAGIEVSKACTSGTIPETGGSTTYTVTATNPAEVAVVTLTSLTDSLFGDVTAIHAAGGGYGAVTATTCNGTFLTLNPSDSKSCTFTATAPAGDTGDKLLDTVTVCYTDSFNNSGCPTASAQCTYTDVQEPPTLAKDVAACGAVNFALDVTYTVVVTNTSPTPPGDTLTLSALNDNKFGDLTTVHAAGGGYAAVSSTTCGKAVADGGPGALPYTINPGGNYTCQFTGVVVGAGSITHTNTATGTATDDDEVTYYPYDDATMGVTITKSGCP